MPTDQLDTQLTPGQVAYEAFCKATGGMPSRDEIAEYSGRQHELWEAAAQAVREPLLNAIEETVDVYECLTRGNPLQPLCFGQPVRDLWYKALGREPIPANIPADFDPTFGAMRRHRLSEQNATLRAALERIVAIEADDPDCLRDTWQNLCRRAVELARAALDGSGPVQEAGS